MPMGVQGRRGTKQVQVTKTPKRSRQDWKEIKCRPLARSGKGIGGLMDPVAPRPEPELSGEHSLGRGNKGATRL